MHSSPDFSTVPSAPSPNTQTAAYFDSESTGWSGRYQNNRHFQDRLKTVLHWLGNEPAGLSLLDYGCGSGVLTRELALAGHHLTGMDISEGMLAAARESCQGLPQPVRFEQIADNFSVKSLDAIFDGVLCLGVIEYAEEPNALLAELTHTIKPGGFLLVSFPNRHSYLRAIEGFVFRHPGLFKSLGLFPHLSGPDSYLHYQRHQFSRHDLVQFLAEHGFFLEKSRFHVAPKSMSVLAKIESIGMTAIALFRKPIT